jgi:hypothetical protein
MAEARADAEASGRPARRFRNLRWSTRESWSRVRRVVGKAAWTQGEADRHFVVTSLEPAEAEARHLYEAICCARGEPPRSADRGPFGNGLDRLVRSRESRIEECQLDLLADRTSAATMRASQLRLSLASPAYVLLCALRRIGLAHAQLATATCGTIRPKLLKIGAPVRVSVRRVSVAMASGCPFQAELALAHGRLRRASA